MKEIADADFCLGEEIFIMRHLKFLKEYLRSFDPIDSWMKAGHKSKNKHVADVSARRVLADHRVKEFLKRKFEELKAPIKAGAIDITADDVLFEMRKLARDPEAPHASRVSAWRAIGAFLGLGSTVNVKHSGNLSVTEINYADITVHTDEYNNSLPIPAQRISAPSTPGDRQGDKEDSPLLA